MKTIIYITSRRLLPLDSGDKLLTYNLLERLSSHYDIYLLNLNEGRKYSNNEIVKINKISKSFKKLSILNRHSLYKLFKSMLSGKMYWKIKLENEQIQQEIKTFIDLHSDAEVIVWDHLRSSIFFEKNKRKNILIEHNNESVAIQSRSSRTKNIILKYFFTRQADIMKYYIESIHNKMDKIIYLSQNDFMDLSKKYPQKYHLMNRLILNFTHKPYPVKSQTNKTKLLFIGSLDWYPNIEAIQWFLEDIFPLLQEDIEYQFNIVGRNPDKKLIEYIDSIPNVALHADVPSVEDFYLNSDILIAPIRSGSGINIKVLEALSYGIPIVMTSFAKRGYEGLQFIESADAPDEFIQEIHKLSNVEQKRKLHTLEIEYYKQYQLQSNQILQNLFLV